MGSNLPATTERIPTENGCLHQPLCLVLGHLPVSLSLQHRAQHLQHYLWVQRIQAQQLWVLFLRLFSQCWQFDECYSVHFLSVEIAIFAVTLYARIESYSTGDESTAWSHVSCHFLTALYSCADTCIYTCPHRGELQLLKKQRAVLAQLWGAGTAQHCQQCVELQDLFLLAYPDPSSKCHHFYSAKMSLILWAVLSVNQTRDVNANRWLLVPWIAFCFFSYVQKSCSIFPVLQFNDSSHPWHQTCSSFLSYCLKGRGKREWSIVALLRQPYGRQYVTRCASFSFLLPHRHCHIRKSKQSQSLVLSGGGAGFPAQSWCCCCEHTSGSISCKHAVPDQGGQPLS